MKQRFDVLDIFRGLFASLVFLFHLGPFAKTPILNNEFVRNADMFVDFFFVLSGFVIAINYERLTTWKDFGNFYKKRFLRIYPLHFFILFCFLGVELAKLPLSTLVHVNNLNNPNNNIITFLTSLSLTNSLPIFGISDVSWNIASWSISAEMIAYLFFGLLMMGINTMRMGAYKAYVYIGFIILAVFSLVNITGSFQLNYNFNYGFLRGLIGFFSGVLCYNFFVKTQARLKNISDAVFSISELLICAIVILAICSGEKLKSVGLIYEILFFICVFTFAFERGLISKQIKKIKILQLAGKYSYSIYMTHTLLLSLFNIVFFRLLKLPPSAYAYLFIVNYIIIFMVSAWTYKHIEMRFYGKKEKINNTDGLDLTRSRSVPKWSKPALKA